MNKWALSALGAVVVVAIVSTSAFAQRGSVHNLDRASVLIPGPDGRAVFEKTLEDIPALLRKLQPGGAKITNKQVEDIGPRGLPRISFTATKQEFFVSVTVNIKGDVRDQSITCNDPGTNAAGYRLTMDLDDSDKIVSDNGSEIVADVCLKEHSDGSIEVLGKTSLVEGPSFGVIVGPAIVDTLKQQTRPLIQAFSARAAEIRAHR